MENKFLFRFYSNPEQSQNRVVVIGEHSEGVLKIAVSRCSKKDNFIREKGRAIAEGRLAKGKLYQIIQANEMNVETFVEHAKRIAKEVETTKKIFNT